MITFLPAENQTEIARSHLGDLAPGFEVEALTPAHVVNPKLTPSGFQVFPSADAFFEHGFGLCIMHNGEMVALTTSYTVSYDKVEIAISTDPSYRQKGLASGLGAAMVLECERRGKVPHWSASNPISQRIARRIGFVDAETCPFIRT